MRIVILLLLAAGPVGAIDATYFHLWRFRLYRRRQSRKEELTHLVRGSLFPIGLAVVLIGRPEGTWYWALLGLFALDFTNTVLDGLAEPGSRAPIGLPPSELAVHYTGTTLIGCSLAAFAIYGWDGRTNPTRLVPYPDGYLPGSVFVLGYVAVAAAVALVLFEASLFLRALRRSPSPHAPSDTAPTTSA